jgi:predicted nuclease of predicted toxin-antitoxin system
MQGDSDEEQLRVATTEGRVLITHDPDVLALVQSG